jgi:antitoxin CptB
MYRLLNLREIRSDLGYEWVANAPISREREQICWRRGVRSTGLFMDGFEIRRKRALYRAHHRGTKELDLILGRYAKERVSEMDEARLTVFEQLLSSPDPDIEQWIRGRQAPDDVASAVAEVRAFYALED